MSPRREAPLDRPVDGRGKERVSIGHEADRVDDFPSSGEPDPTTEDDSPSPSGSRGRFDPESFPVSFPSTNLVLDDDNDESVLRELDRLHEELTSHRTDPDGNAAPGPALAAEWDESPRPTERASLGAPSPYLEEHLAIARSAVSELVRRSQGVGRDLAGLRNALVTIDREIDRVSAELGYMRSNPWDEAGTEEGSWRVPHAPSETGPTTVTIGQHPPSGLSSPAGGEFFPSAPGPFSEFTLTQYNRTVSEIHARRRTIGWGTVAAAAVISTALFYLTLQAREPAPSIWLAVLPIVWMVPVPFFVAAFRGTQRILSQNRLELSEET